MPDKRAQPGIVWDEPTGRLRAPLNNVFGLIYGTRILRDLCGGQRMHGDRNKVQCLDGCSETLRLRAAKELHPPRRQVPEMPLAVPQPAEVRSRSDILS